MKRLFQCCLAACLILGLTLLAGCGEPEPTPAPAKVTLTVVNGSGSGTFDRGSTVTATARDADEEEAFVSWEIGGENVGETKTVSFEIFEDTTLTAVFSTTYSVWDGVYPAEQPEGYVDFPTSQTARIYDAAGLAWFAKQFEGESKALRNYSVYLEKDIDLAGKDWKGIDCGYPFMSTPGGLDSGVIDGQNHVIKNMKTAVKDSAFGTGLRGGGFFSNIGGPATGTPSCTQKIVIRNLTFKDAEVTGNGQMGVVAGSVQSTDLTLENVHVIGSTLTAEAGHKVGGLIGRVGSCDILTREILSIKNCSVKDTSLSAKRNMGGLVGTIFTHEVIMYLNYQGFIANYQAACGADAIKDCNELGDFFRKCAATSAESQAALKKQIDAATAAGNAELAASLQKEFDLGTKIIAAGLPPAVLGLITGFVPYEPKFEFVNNIVSGNTFAASETADKNIATLYGVISAYYDPVKVPEGNHLVFYDNSAAVLTDAAE